MDTPWSDTPETDDPELQGPQGPADWRRETPSDARFSLMVWLRLLLLRDAP